MKRGRRGKWSEIIKVMQKYDNIIVRTKQEAKAFHAAAANLGRQATIRKIVDGYRCWIYGDRIE